MKRAPLDTRPRPPWPTGFDLLRVVAGALVLNDPKRPSSLKGKQVQRFCRGEIGSLSQHRLLEIVRALAARFLIEDPMLMRIVAWTDDEVAAAMGAPNVTALLDACAKDPRIATFVSAAKDTGRARDRAAIALLNHVAAWEEFAQWRGPRQPPQSLKRWLLGQLRIAVVDLAIFCGHMAFKLKIRPDGETLPTWTRVGRDDKALRNLCQRENVTRADLFERMMPTGPGNPTGRDRYRTTVDRWFDQGRRPSDAHLGRIAEVLETDTGRRARLRQELRRHYALREIVEEIGGGVGHGEVVDMVSALMRLAAETYDRLEQTRVCTTMHATICDFVLGDWMGGAPSPRIVAHLLARESERRWRTALRALRLAARYARHPPRGLISYPRPVLMTELVDATRSNLFA